MHLDNLKIRTKLILIYIVCVLLPVIVSNTLVMFLVLQMARKEQQGVMVNAAERIQYEINQSVSDAISVSDYLYRDKGLNEFLRKSYSDESEYYEHFNKLMENNVIRYYYTAQSVYEVTICTENQTITNGSYFQKMQEAEDEEWYQRYMQEGKAIGVYAYYEKEKPYLAYTNRARRISVIRKMDYNLGADILKLDIDYLKLTEEIRNEQDAGAIYLCDGEKIVYASTESAPGGEDFLSLSQIEKRGMSIEKEIPVLGNEWKVLITTKPYSFWRGLEGQRVISLILLIVNLILPSVMIILVNRSFQKRVALTGKYLEGVEQGRFEEIHCKEGKDEIGGLIRSYNFMVVKVKGLIEDVYQKNAEKQMAELSRKQAELNALQSQMNPHFMFNTMESIRMRSLVKGEKETAQMIEKFSALLRKAIRWDRDFVEVSREAEDVKDYLDIQKYRFGERLTYSVYIQEGCESRKIPKFSILTLVENACVHGIERRVEGGAVTVVVSQDEKHMFLEVMDSGGGMSQEELTDLREKIAGATMDHLHQSSRIGILNTVVRLKLYYEGRVEFEIDSAPNEGTEICVTLPLVYNQGLEKSQT